ncbi:MAG: phosphatidate cytidylyltransferase [bacterium]
MLFRLISSAVLLPLFVWALFHAGIGFRLFLVLALLLGYEEYRRILGGAGLKFGPWLGLAALLTVFLPPALGAGFLPPWAASWLSPWAGGLGLAFLFLAAALARILNADAEQGLPAFVAELGGLAYLGLLGVFLIKLHAFADGPWWVFLVFWYAWVYDSGALFVGKSVGKTPFSSLSPKKTWEGFWGGLAFNAVLSALILPHLVPATFPLSAWGFAALSLPAAALAQMGDLFESMIKRFARVKDSSRWIAAHGGFLDKMDSSLFVGPLLYLVAVLLGR